LAEILPTVDPLHISGTAEAIDSSACSVCAAFDAAFAKLLWPLVKSSTLRLLYDARLHAINATIEISSIGLYCTQSAFS